MFEELQKQRSMLWAKATAALARREHSVQELRQKLKSKTEGDVVEEVINALLKDDLVNDERFAHMLCRSRYNKGVGPVRLEYELKQHKVSVDIIEQEMFEYENRWINQLQKLNERKYGANRPVNYQAWSKQARFFQQRGFTSSQIQQAIPR